METARSREHPQRVYPWKRPVKIQAVCPNARATTYSAAKTLALWAPQPGKQILLAPFFLVTALVFEGSLQPIDPTCPAVVRLFFCCNQEPVLHGRATVYPTGGRRVGCFRPARESNRGPLDRQSCTLTTRPRHRVSYLYLTGASVDQGRCEGGGILRP